MRAYPGRGIPHALRDIGDVEERTAATLVVADAPEATFLWWDLRIHPNYGTLEVREMDTQSSLESASALGALVRLLALRVRDKGTREHEPSEALSWSAFRAARDGTEATILDDGALRPLREVALRVVSELRPLAKESGDADSLDGISKLLEHGGGAGRQRAAFARGGMPGMLRWLVDDTVASAHDAGAVWAAARRVGG